MPVYENYGNHDGDTSGVVRSGIRERNKNRKNLKNISDNGLHYSWDWGKYHFVSLGSYPSDKWDSTCGWCHYFKNSFREPQKSLSFLKEDLQQYGYKKKIIIYFHYGWDSFSKLWWTEDEQEKFYDVIKDYNIAAIFTGHNHATGYLKWKGIDVYSAGSPQSGKKTGSFLLVNASNDSLHVIERRLNKWGNQSYKKSVL
jgi:cytolysin (calcineurin-like family phosphatase)